MTQNKTLTDNEAFEKWFDANRELYDDNSTYDLMQIAWVAAKHESAKEIAELKEELSILKPHPKCDMSCLLACSMEADAFEHEYNRATELTAQVNQLREKLENALTSLEESQEKECRCYYTR